MKGFGKALLVGPLVGGIAALIAFTLATLLVQGDDPERIRLGATLAAAFLCGTVACGFSAARFERVHPFRTATLAAVAFEVILMLVARPGLGVRVIAVAMGAAALFALIGAFMGMPRRK
jgi:hypothetical protein